jgi:hypothetical protein
MDPFYSKVDNTFDRVMADINKFEQVFKQGGKLEQAIMQVGGDPTVLPKIAEALSAVYELLEDAHYDALAHIDPETGERIAGESVTEGRKLTEGVLDGDDEDGFMARSQLYFLARDAIKLHGQINDRDNLEPWVQAKITAAAEGIDAVQRYTEYQTMKADSQLPMAVEPQPDMGMESTVTEGTWAIPDTPEALAELAELMKNPIPANKASDLLYHLVGDDSLADNIGEIEDRTPAADVRSLVHHFLKQWGIELPVAEAANPYAIGTAQAMKSTGDKPPLKKATINKAHKIANAIVSDSTIVSNVAEEAKFNDKRDGALKSVAQNMFKNALASAKKKAQ